MNMIDKKYIKSCMIARSILLLIVAAIYAVGLYYNILYIQETSISALLVWAIPCGALILFIAIYALLFPVLQYRVFRYEITDDRINIVKGVIFRQNHMLPIVRLQHVSVIAGPINRIFGIAILNINTAGAAENIVGLDFAIAKQLCEQLKCKLDARLADSSGE